MLSWKSCFVAAVDSSESEAVHRVKCTEWVDMWLTSLQEASYRSRLDEAEAGGGLRIWAPSLWSSEPLTATGWGSAQSKACRPLLSFRFTGRISFKDLLLLGWGLSLRAGGGVTLMVALQAAWTHLQRYITNICQKFTLQLLLLCALVSRRCHQSLPVSHLICCSISHIVSEVRIYVSARGLARFTSLLNLIYSLITDDL